MLKLWRRKSHIHIFLTWWLGCWKFPGDCKAVFLLKRMWMSSIPNRLHPPLAWRPPVNKRVDEGTFKGFIKTKDSEEVEKWYTVKQPCYQNYLMKFLSVHCRGACYFISINQISSSFTLLTQLLWKSIYIYIYIMNVNMFHAVRMLKMFSISSSCKDKNRINFVSVPTHPYKIMIIGHFYIEWLFYVIDKF